VSESQSDHHVHRACGEKMLVDVILEKSEREGMEGEWELSEEGRSKGMIMVNVPAKPPKRAA